MRHLASSFLILIAAVFAAGCETDTGTAPPDMPESAPSESPQDATHHAAPEQPGSGTTN